MSVAARSASPRDYERRDALDALSHERRFEQLVDRHERRLRRLIFGVVGAPDRVDDVLQETLLRAYHRLPTLFANEGHEVAWLSRIAYRCSLNELRARRRRRESPGLPDESWFASSEEAVGALEIAAALRTLPVKMRATVVLVDVIGLDYETAARALRVPRGTLAWRLSVARDQLRDALDGRGNDA